MDVSKCVREANLAKSDACIPIVRANLLPTQESFNSDPGVLKVVASDVGK